jgi:uncharacterized membrane protein YuzA (DUF378 family)
MTGAKCGVCKVIGVLAGLGALNWGLYGVFNLDLVARLLGEMTTASKVVYGVLGVAGLLTLVSLVKCCPCAGKKSCCETKS